MSNIKIKHGNILQNYEYVIDAIYKFHNAQIPYPSSTIL